MRLFHSETSTQVAWLIATALIRLVSGPRPTAKSAGCWRRQVLSHSSTSSAARDVHAGSELLGACLRRGDALSRQLADEQAPRRGHPRQSPASRSQQAEDLIRRRATVRQCGMGRLDRAPWCTTLRHRPARPRDRHRARSWPRRASGRLDRDLDTAAQMVRSEFRHRLVVDGDRTAWVLSMRDVVGAGVEVTQPLDPRTPPWQRARRPGGAGGPDPTRSCGGAQSPRPPLVAARYAASTV